MEHSKHAERELFATEEHKLQARDIVFEELGPNFDVDFDFMPKNVGVMGDERVVGHTVWISGHVYEPGRFLMEHDDIFERVSNRICNETGVVSKVLFEVTPLSHRQD